MARLKDFINEKRAFYEQPPPIVQSIDPCDDVADTILRHMQFGYTMTSITPISFGPSAGRMLLLFQKTR
jgi:hypothetical protein